MDISTESAVWFTAAGTLFGALAKMAIDYARLKHGAEKDADERAYSAFRELLGNANTRLDLAFMQIEALGKAEAVCREEMARKSTELDTLKRELRELRSQLSVHSLVSTAIMESVKEAIIVINEKGQIQSWNHAATRLFGWIQGEVIGQNVSLIMPKKEAREHDSYLENYMRTGQGQIIGVGRVVTALHKDGWTFEAELSVSEMTIMGSKRRLFTGVLRPFELTSDSGIHGTGQRSAPLKTNQKP